MPDTPSQYNARHLTMLGHYSIRQGDFATAVQAFRKVVEHEPDSAAAYQNLGVAYYKEGEFEQAKDALRRAGKLNPESAAPQFALGLIARDERDYDAAIEAFTEAIGRYAGDSRAWYNRGIVRFYLDDHDGAVADLRHAIALNPGDVDAHYNLAVVYASSGRWEEAQECLMRCVVKDPQRVEKYVAVLTDIGRAQAYEVLYRRGHRIKNALGALGARLRNLVHKLYGEETVDECRERFDAIVGDHERLFGQMATYLMTMKSDERSIEVVNLNTLLESLVETFRNRTGTGIKYVTAFDERVPTVLADQAALAEALGNILLNAIEAIEHTGTVTVTTAFDQAPDPRTAAIVATIADTGAGIAPDHLGEVFKVGFTTKKTGSGIGLPVARRTIELHGGTIELLSVQGKGTTATIRIPRHVDTTKLRRPIPIRSSIFEDPGQLIAIEDITPGGMR
ncbi:MAG: tetratricopeptide repeat protein [Verrucomicrobia bacterium]|nr:tetratricopeptide repeat protein [Verrucomicrobiota bacterium]